MRNRGGNNQLIDDVCGLGSGLLIVQASIAGDAMRNTTASIHQGISTDGKDEHMSRSVTSDHPCEYSGGRSSRYRLIAPW